MNLDPGEFFVRPILHAGEGPVDLRESRKEHVIGARSVEQALATVMEDALRRDVGAPSFDNSGEETLSLHFLIEDHAGNRKSYCVTARLRIETTLEEIPTPLQENAHA